MLQIKKRDGRIVPYDREKIVNAIFNAAKAVGGADYQIARTLGENIEKKLFALGKETLCIESIQDVVEKELVESGHYKTAKAYILYRQDRNTEREKMSAHRQIMRELTFEKAEDSNIKRENANIDGNTAMGTMLKYGSESAKEFFVEEVLPKEFGLAHKNGDIHIHDLDFLTLTETCCQIPLGKLLEKGFSTGHGFIRTPSNIVSAAAITCICLQANQNDRATCF